MKTVIILHGWASDTAKWQSLIRGLKETGFKVLLPNLPGFKTKISRPFSIEDYSAWLKDYLKEKKLTKVNLLGHSFGGQIAIHFSAENPKSVERLVLMASAGIRNQFSLKKWLFLPVAKVGKLVIKSTAAKKILYRLAREHDYFNASSTMKETLKIIANQDQQANMAKIKAKTLILWGSVDKATPLKLGKMTHRLLSDSRLQVFAGVGHNLPFVKADELVPLISKFLK